MKYKDYVTARQKEVNDLPIFWAFNNEQFREGMEARGLTENDVDKIYSLGGGGYYLKSDSDVIKAFFMKKSGLKKLMRDYDFCRDACYYEMCNHEYGINLQGDWDVMSCFGSVEYTDAENELETYFDKLRWSKKQRQAYRDARIQYYEDAEKGGWL